MQTRCWQVHRVTATSIRVPDGYAGARRLEGIDDRERALELDPGDLFVTNPDYRVDARLTRFFTRSGFAHLAEETRRNYSTDCCLFFNFLWQRGKGWDEAKPDDLWDFQDWRRFSPRNPQPISGAKWNRELAALRRLYSWAVRQQIMAASPVVERELVTGRGQRVSVPEARAKDVRSANVKWLTPRAYRLWRDVGLRGYTADLRRDPSWRGRNDDRNAAYADLLFSSGMRRSEGGSLLTIEVPGTQEADRHFFHGRVAREVTKNRRGRTFYAAADVLRAIDAYVRTSRRAAIRRAQAAGRYERIPDAPLVLRRTGWKGSTLVWEQGGRRVERTLDSLGVEARMKLFTMRTDGPEPLWLWLAEDGMPFRPHSWEAVYRAASERCGRLLAGRMIEPPFMRPHMARHSFALHMLVVLQRAMDTRFGVSPEDRRAMRELYGDVWHLVKDLLGHRSVEVTRSIYLAPVSDLQIRALLMEEPDVGVGELLAQVAALSGQVLDAQGMA